MKTESEILEKRKMLHQQYMSRDIDLITKGLITLELDMLDWVLE